MIAKMPRWAGVILAIPKISVNFVTLSKKKELQLSLSKEHERVVATERQKTIVWTIDNIVDVNV